MLVVREEIRNVKYMKIFFLGTMLMNIRSLQWDADLCQYKKNL